MWSKSDSLLADSIQLCFFPAWRSCPNCEAAAELTFLLLPVPVAGSMGQDGLGNE